MASDDKQILENILSQLIEKIEKLEKEIKEIRDNLNSLSEDVSYLEDKLEAY